MTEVEGISINLQNIERIQARFPGVEITTIDGHEVILLPDDHDGSLPGGFEQFYDEWDNHDRIRCQVRTPAVSHRGYVLGKLFGALLMNPWNWPPHIQKILDDLEKRD